jgi:hypothetical protein
MMLQRRRSRGRFFGASGAIPTRACPGFAFAQSKTPVRLAPASTDLLAVAAKIGCGDDATMSIVLLNASPIKIPKVLKGHRSRNSRHAQKNAPKFHCAEFCSHGS